MRRKRERENWRSKESKCKWVVLKERVRKMRGKEVRGERWEERWREEARGDAVTRTQVMSG